MSVWHFSTDLRIILSRQTFTRFLRNPSKKIRSAMFKKTTNLAKEGTPKLGDDRKSASWQKYLWFSFLKQILSMQVPLWRNTAISSCIEFMDKKFHAHLWESHCKDLFLYEIIMREPLQRFLFIWNNFFLGFWSLQNFLWSYQWMDAGKRKWLSPET